MPVECDFCNEFSGSVENTFDRIYQRNPSNRVLLRSEQFVAIPSLGQIAEGHLLLLPVEHWTALGDLSESRLDELAELSSAMTEILRDTYGRCVTFEHGVRSEGGGGCGIYHAHLHAVPISGVPDPVEFLKSEFRYKQVQGLNELRKCSEGMVGYLFYQDAQSRAYLFDTPNLASQYMRRVLAQSLGTQDWDWRAASREERLLATMERFTVQLGATLERDRWIQKHAP